MKILVTNDDGIEAPGIAELARVAAKFGEVFVVAPERAHSGCGHQVTSDGVISVREITPQRWAIGGTPADCVRVGLSRLVPDADWVFAGINAGANLESTSSCQGQSPLFVKERSLVDPGSQSLITVEPAASSTGLALVFSQQN